VIPQTTPYAALSQQQLGYLFCVAAGPNTVSGDDVMTSERQSTPVTVATRNDEVTSSASVDSIIILGTATQETETTVSDQSSGLSSRSVGMSETTTNGSTKTTLFEAATTGQEMTETESSTTETDATNINESTTNIEASKPASSTPIRYDMIDTSQTTFGADTTTTQQLSTPEQTSSELGLTTISQSPSPSSPPPDIHCCCRCCFPSTLSCTVCEGDTLTDAAECAKKETKTIKPLDRNTPKFEPPSAMEGSMHPERLAYREDFLKSEQLTETLAALPESQKIELGFKSDDLIVDCMYDGSPCSIEELVYM